VNQFLSDVDYKLVTGSVPMVCVDMIAVRKDSDGWHLGVITRATGSQAGKRALIGGRVFYGEQLDQAIARHLKNDLGLEATDFNLLPSNSVDRPFYVQQYWPATASDAPYGFDPSKHSVGLTYLIKLNTEPQPANEATDFHWITEQDLTEPAAYNQHFVLQEAFRFLANS
jgi:ADP-ribose pyrophosphatase YjhB (NUDIX family)